MKDRRELTTSDAAELGGLIAERVGAEGRALRVATRRIHEENERTRQRVQETEEQNRALEQLVREQEAYLAEVTSLIDQMETRRRNWREQYERVTGHTLKESATSSRAR